jgi:hypothetical protein
MLKASPAGRDPRGFEASSKILRTVHCAVIQSQPVEVAPPPVGPEDYGHAPNGRDTLAAPLFKLEDWNDISFDPNDEWRVEDVLPMRGFGLIFGKPRSFKSFVAIHLALSLVLGIPWAGKPVEKGSVVYIAAEGAAGLRKRIAAYKAKHKIPRGQFALLSAAPNLGIGDGDLPALIAAVVSAGITPALIVIDTASKSIGAAEENGIGMAAFVSNAEELARHFGCLVLGVHHVGHEDAKQKRPLGWSGLVGALDVLILCERPGDDKRTTLRVQKLKDEEDGTFFEVRLSRVVVGRDRNGKEASTLVVDEVVKTEVAAQPETGKRSDEAAVIQRELLAAYDRLAEAAPFSRGSNSKSVRKVCVDAIRDELRDRGFLKMDDATGGITNTCRSRFSRAKSELLRKKALVESKKLIWRLS